MASTYDYLTSYVLKEYIKDLLVNLNTEETEFNEFDYCVIVGMGGSGVIGRYLRAIVEEKWAKPVVVADYSNPKIPSKGGFLLLAISYSGATKETNELFKKYSPRAKKIGVVSGRGELLSLGLQKSARIVEVSGAPAPRFGFAKMFSAALSIFTIFTGESWLCSDVRSAAANLSVWFNNRSLRSQVDDVVKYLKDGVPVVYGSEHLAPVSYRWKTQFNENTKIPAFHSCLPEANHNEVNGWRGTSVDFRGILLKSPSYQNLTKASVEAYARAANLALKHLTFDGENIVEEMLKATVFGDLVSIRLAQHLNAEPLRVPVIDKVKKIQSEQLALFEEKQY
jgi:glucose/mannose-6-phosphate isomerase